MRVTRPARIGERLDKHRVAKNVIASGDLARHDGVSGAGSSESRWQASGSIRQAWRAVGVTCAGMANQAAGDGVNGKSAARRANKIARRSSRRLGGGAQNVLAGWYGAAIKRRRDVGLGMPGATRRMRWRACGCARGCREGARFFCFSCRIWAVR